MWLLDYAGLLGCMGFCTDSDYSEEFGFIVRNVSARKKHRVMWAQSVPGDDSDLHIVVRVALVSPVAWVDIDLRIDKEYLLEASLLTLSTCTHLASEVRLP